jgi:hypothetical protein
MLCIVLQYLLLHLWVDMSRVQCPVLTYVIMRMEKDAATTNIDWVYCSSSQALIIIS